MSAPKFTPGPWHADLAPGGGEFWIYGSDDDLLATATGRNQDTDKANAALIAASPDMYEALLAVRRHLESEHEIAEVEALIDHALARVVS